MKSYIDLLSRYGYIVRDHVKDFGQVIPYVYYALRKRGNVHEYVSLVSYEGQFCEAVYELFYAEKNTYKRSNFKPSESAKRGFTSLLSALPRSFVDLEKQINKTEDEIKESVNKLMDNLLKAEKVK